jgi:hypothetical protein
MADFFTNLNKGLENIVPLAMKKFELDSEEAKWRANNAIQQETLGIAKEKWGQEVLEKKRENEIMSAIQGDVSNLEALKSRLPAMDANIAQAQVGAGPDVDPEYMMSKLRGAEGERAGFIPQVVAAKEKLSPQNLLMRIAPTDPKIALTGMASLIKDDTSRENMLLRIQSALENTGLKNETAIQRALITALSKKETSENKLLPAQVENNIKRVIEHSFLSDATNGPALQKKLERAQLQFGPQVSLYNVLDTTNKQRFDTINEYATEAVQKGQAKTYTQAHKIAEERFKKEQGGTKAAPGGAGGYTWSGGKLVPNK